MLSRKKPKSEVLVEKATGRESDRLKVPSRGRVMETRGHKALESGPENVYASVYDPKPKI